MSNVKHYQQPKKDELKSIGNQGKERGGNGGLVAKLCQTLVTPWTPACQAPLPMGFSRQEYWSGLPFPFPKERGSSIDNNEQEFTREISRHQR